MPARLSSHFILGGARSGKSRYALGLARGSGGRVAFVATARNLDGDMGERIARHRAERPRDWLTVEEPLDVVGACRRVAGQVDLVLVDCLTLWVSNRLLRGEDEAAIIGAGEDLARLLAEGECSFVIVSNEVGEGVHPSTVAGIRFRDLLGAVNQRVAAAADRVTLMVAGIPLGVKEARDLGAGQRSQQRVGRDRAPEAP